MSWQRAIPLKKDELETLARRRSLADLRSRVRDVPAPRSLAQVLEPPKSRFEASPNPGGMLLIPTAQPGMDFGASSPFSIEALVAAEMSERGQPDLLRAPKVQLFPELKRREMPPAEAKVPYDRQKPVVEVFGAVLEARPPALVVWTDRFYYGSAPEDLSAVRSWFRTRRDEYLEPVLIRADLFIDPYQLFETVVLGGDGVVITVAAAGKDQLEDLLGWSAELGLQALCYVTDAADTDRALASGGKHFAIGEGDLFDFDARLEPGAGWLRELGKELPKGAARLSWGGVRSVADVDARAQAGASALVVGRAWGRVREALRQREDSEG